MNRLCYSSEITVFDFRMENSLGRPVFIPYKLAYLIGLIDGFNGEDRGIVHAG